MIKNTPWGINLKTFQNLKLGSLAWMPLEDKQTPKRLKSTLSNWIGIDCCRIKSGQRVLWVYFFSLNRTFSDYNKSWPFQIQVRAIAASFFCKFFSHDQDPKEGKKKKKKLGLLKYIGKNMTSNIIQYKKKISWRYCFSIQQSSQLISLKRFPLKEWKDDHYYPIGKVFKSRRSWLFIELRTGQFQ